MRGEGGTKIDYRHVMNWGPCFPTPVNLAFTSTFWVQVTCNVIRLTFNYNEKLEYSITRTKQLKITENENRVSVTGNIGI